MYLLKNDTLSVCELYKLNLVTYIAIRINDNCYYIVCYFIPSLILVSGGNEVKLHDIVSDRVVLNVIPFSSLLNTHRNVSPAGSVGIQLPGANDTLTCMQQRFRSCMFSRLVLHFTILFCPPNHALK